MTKCSQSSTATTGYSRGGKARSNRPTPRRSRDTLLEADIPAPTPRALTRPRRVNRNLVTLPVLVTLPEPARPVILPPVTRPALVILQAVHPVTLRPVTHPVPPATLLALVTPLAVRPDIRQALPDTQLARVTHRAAVIPQARAVIPAARILLRAPEDTHRVPVILARPTKKA